LILRHFSWYSLPESRALKRAHPQKRNPPLRGGPGFRARDTQKEKWPSYDSHFVYSLRGCRDKVIAAACFYVIFSLLFAENNKKPTLCARVFSIEKSLNNPPVCGRLLKKIRFKIIKFMRFLLRINAYRSGLSGSLRGACLCCGPSR